VVIAEDSYLVREGVTRLLATDPDIEVVATCADYDEVIAALEREGFVARTPAANHGRVLEMTVTKVGLDVLARCDRAVSEMEDRMLADLDAEARAQLLKALTDCVHRLGAGLPDA
jgi:DNA-binding MarR family transcriptional regulator